MKGFARIGSNPVVVDLFYFLCMQNACVLMKIPCFQDGGTGRGAYGVRQCRLGNILAKTPSPEVRLISFISFRHCDTIGESTQADLVLIALDAPEYTKHNY